MAMTVEVSYNDGQLLTIWQYTVFDAKSTVVIVQLNSKREKGRSVHSIIRFCVNFVSISCSCCIVGSLD